MGEFDPILVKPEITLEYEPLDTDMTPQAPIAKSWEAITPYLAVERNKAGKIIGVFPHGNSVLRIKRGGVDVSKQYTPLRFIRIWEADLNEQGERVGPFKKPTRRRGFNLDSKDYTKPLWIDIPAMRYFSQEKKRKRFLYEFIVTTQRRRLHWIYFLFILDITPTNFRIHMSHAITVAPDLVDPHVIWVTPFRDDSTNGPMSMTWAKDSGWQSYVDPKTQVDLMKALPP